MKAEPCPTVVASRITPRGRRASGVGAFVAVFAVTTSSTLLSAPKPADACPFYDPVCWVEEAVDFFADILSDLASLVTDILTVDLDGLVDDIVSIGINIVCGSLTVEEIVG